MFTRKYYALILYCERKNTTTHYELLYFNTFSTRENAKEHAQDYIIELLEDGFEGNISQLEIYIMEGLDKLESIKITPVIHFQNDLEYV